jgi:glycosyltransferase involved in cell wall biosynthesis/peptidoglycan/xylan/chitin deacetylase (PgdA/CDA1 family)/SAM-dependent methyltransferase
MVPLDILQVSPADPTAERLWGCSIEQPVQGTQVDGRSVELRGWVLGRQSPAVAVEAVHEGVVLRRVSLSLPRPDVAAVFPHVSEAERSGFRATLSLPTIKPELELLVQAVLQDQSRVPMVSIRTCLCWREGMAASDVPLISVIVPCYNQAHFLTEAIESILSQAYPHYEIVVIDDGSTDNTAEVAGRYPGVRCLRQENRGLAAARNTGLRKSNGDYLVFLDADDRLLPHALEVGLACLRAHPQCAFVAGRCIRIGSDSQPLPTTEDAGLDGDAYSRLLSGCPILVPAVMYRRASFQVFPGFDTSMSAAEDYHLYYRIARELPIHFHDIVVAEVRQHHANMTSNTALMLRSNLTALQTQWQYVKANPEYKEAYRAGLRFWRTHYGGRLAAELPNRIRLGEWKRALSAIVLLLRYYPQGLAGALHDWFRLWNVREARACAGEGPQESDAADNGTLALRRPADRPAPQGDPVGGIPPVGKARFGDLRRLTPISSNWGLDRGRPIDRYYVEKFLAQHASTIRGRVLEIGDNSYTKAFGGDRVAISDVLHVTEGNPMATIVGDLTRAGHIPSDSFDCIILTQTLQLIYDARAALQTLHRILKPDGVLLATFPGITQIARDEWAASWCWHFTTLSARRLFEEVFARSHVQIECYGNVLASTAFLYGLAVDELDKEELDYRDPDYELLITVKAVKVKEAEAARPVRSDNGSGAPKHRVPIRARAISRSAGAHPMRILVTGWFSFEDGHATAGDLLSCDLVCEWLEAAGCGYDVALVPPLGVGVDWRSVDPEYYSHVVFVCGPFGDGPNVRRLLDRFAHCRLVGLNLSMLAPLEQWNPFDLLLERDSSMGARPDITFLSRATRVPIVGLILVEPHEGALDQVANEAINRLMQSREMVTVPIDTRLDTNSTGLRSAAQVESLIARMDLVITTRLHGLVLALKNGVPAIAIDPIPGGFKIERQAHTVGWPVVLPVDGLTNERLEKAFDFCLTEEARTTAGECYKRAVRTAETVKHELISFVREPVSSSTGNGSHSIFEIVDIFYPEQPLESLWGCSIEQPAQGAQVSSGSVDLAGWVLGRRHPAVAVEVVHEGVALRRVSLNPSRPDVAAAFPHVPGAERSGFRTTLSLSTSRPELELLVQAVLQDQSRMPLAVIRARLRSSERHEYEEPARLPDDSQPVNPAVTVNSVTTNSRNPTVLSSLAAPVNSLSISGVAQTEDSHPTAFILLYHRITEAMSDPWSLCVTSNHFAEHLETLRRYTRIIKLAELINGLENGALPERSVVITFDDGYADNLHNAKQVLERYDAPATVFITTGYIGHGREFWWDTLEKLFLAPGRLPESLHLTINGCVFHWELGEAAYYDSTAFWSNRRWQAQNDPPTLRHELYRILWERLVPMADRERRRVLDELLAWAGVDPLVRSTHRSLSVDEICALASTEIVDIGAHSVTHPMLAALPVALQRDEVRRSKVDLEEILGRPVSWFAYPYGSSGTYTEESVGVVRQAGFAAACSGLPGSVELRTDRFQLPRVKVCDWDGDEFARRLSNLVPGL